MIIAGLLALVSVLGLLIFITRRKPEAPALAAVHATTQVGLSSAGQSPPLDTVVAEVHAAVPSVPATAEENSANSVPPPLPATAKPIVAPRPIGQAPAVPRYTYFGHRR